MNFGNLLHWALVFLVVALVAALFGFGGVAGTAMEGARILFWVALVLLVVSMVFGFARRGR
ncbi:MAG: rane protein [Hyphomicrobiales bacterium]|nr:rane protein [Hyphomicrobiales bacterium]